MLQNLILVLGGIGGAVATFGLQKYGFSAVVASSLIGLVGAGIGYMFHIPQLPAIVFAASFAGMTALSIGSWSLMAAAGAVTAVLFLVTTHIFPGFGGKLGTTAFVSTVFCFYLFLILKKTLS